MNDAIAVEMEQALCHLQRYALAPVHTCDFVCSDLHKGMEWA